MLVHDCVGARGKERGIFLLMEESFEAISGASLPWSNKKIFSLLRLSLHGR